MAVKCPDSTLEDRERWLYASVEVYRAKHGLLPEWHPTWAALTPAEWLESPWTVRTSGMSTQNGTALALIEATPERELIPESHVEARLIENKRSGHKSRPRAGRR